LYKYPKNKKWNIAGVTIEDNIGWSYIVYRKITGKTKYVQDIARLIRQALLIMLFAIYPKLILISK
jgi:hypothetical protein